MDYCYAFNLPVLEREYRKESTGNFGHDLLRITWYIINAFHNQQQEEAGGVVNNNVEYGGRTLNPGHDWGYVVVAIEAFCGWYDIDLKQHIAWKMHYNHTRPYKHNKNY